jgi:hypothetical protein
MDTPGFRSNVWMKNCQSSKAARPAKERSITVLNPIDISQSANYQPGSRQLTPLHKSNSGLYRRALALDRSIGRKSVPHVVEVFRPISLEICQPKYHAGDDRVTYRTIRVWSALHYDLNNSHRIDHDLDDHASGNAHSQPPVAVGKALVKEPHHSGARNHGCGHGYTHILATISSTPSGLNAPVGCEAKSYFIDFILSSGVK